MTVDTSGDGRVDDVGEVVRCQHRELRRLFGDVEAARGRRRLEVLEDLVRYLAVHETLEEDLVYPALRAAGPDGHRVADARRDEEREITAMLHDLQGVGTEGDEFVRRLALLREAVLSHARAEERTVLPLLATAGDALGRRMADAVGIAASDVPMEPDDPMAAAIDGAHEAAERVAP